MKVYETKDNQYNEHNGGGLKMGWPAVSSKKKGMKDDVSSTSTKKCLSLDDTKMVQKMEQKGGDIGMYICMWWLSEANHRGEIKWEAEKTL